MQIDPQDKLICLRVRDAGHDGAVMPPIAQASLFRRKTIENLLDGLSHEEICALAKNRGILTVLDNTVSTPLLQKPLTLGVDLVMHACSKYVGGHGDVIGPVFGLLFGALYQLTGWGLKKLPAPAA